jgi:5-(carboxyamino)imidazole ribonucleotide synthase
VSAPILPGATIGILGSGQLGRMLAISARQRGYGVAVYSPDRDSPAGQVADREAIGAYDDVEAIRAFAATVDVLTFEFENVSSAATGAAAAATLVRPGGWVLHTSQQRVREKQWLAAHGIPTAPFAVVASAADLDGAMARVGAPAILKTASFGYDGKGQRRIDARSAAPAAWEALGRVECVCEGLVDFTCEVSVVAARSVGGSFAHHGVVENVHANHILDISTAPAALPAPVVDAAVGLARRVVNALDVVGVLCVEMFVTRDGRVLVNELAPRPHNSGHFTIDACVTSQFEQQLRAICGLELGDPRQHRPAAMANLLGDLWEGGTPDWAALAAMPDVKLHLYGKRDPRPGRKMGHLTALADTGAEATSRVREARDRLRRSR